MEPLFSPWRGAYVEDIHKRHEGGCIFCSAFQGDDDSHLVVGRGKVSFAMLNLYPYNPGHILIVPNRHLSRVQELGEAERGELAEWVAKLEGVLRGSYKPDGINVGMNLGKAAGPASKTTSTCIWCPDGTVIQTSCLFSSEPR